MGEGECLCGVTGIFQVSNSSASVCIALWRRIGPQEAVEFLENRSSGGNTGDSCSEVFVIFERVTVLSSCFCQEHASCGDIPESDAVVEDTVIFTEENRAHLRRSAAVIMERGAVRGGYLEDPFPILPPARSEIGAENGVVHICRFSETNRIPIEESSFSSCSRIELVEEGEPHDAEHEFIILLQGDDRPAVFLPAREVRRAIQWIDDPLVR